ncbi:hypothetical protein ACFV07_19515 [Streptomyces anulatus]|uniref:hypothetical protein n=1 Tax=Streptomyces anulatus TaxID=1892 RepID=UPI00368079FB
MRKCLIGFGAFASALALSLGSAVPAPAATGTLKISVLIRTGVDEPHLTKTFTNPADGCTNLGLPWSNSTGSVANQTGVIVWLYPGRDCQGSTYEAVGPHSNLEEHEGGVGSFLVDASAAG